MNPSCQDVRDRLLESDSSASDDASLSAHLATCSECAEFARRARQIRVSLSQLPRVEAPRELDGLVVAATQTGFQQERAVAALSSLARLPAPEELPAKLDRRALEEPTVRPRAPAVLDRLVDEDLRDASAAMARRFAGRLDRRRAPPALRERVEESAFSVLRTETNRRNVVGAAALVLLLASGGWWLRRHAAPAESADFGFEVRYEAGFGGLDPMARNLLGGLSGGAVDVAPRNERGEPR
jgi:hypothetical protein